MILYHGLMDLFFDFPFLFFVKDPKESPDYARIVNNRHFK